MAARRAVIQLCVDQPNSPLRKVLSKDVLCNAVPFLKEGDYKTQGEGVPLDRSFTGVDVALPSSKTKKN